MPKTPAKRRNSTQEEEAKLYKQWSLAVTPISIYTVKVIDDIFKAVKKAVANKINFEVGNDQRLSSYDEKIYRFYRELMDVYYRLSEGFCQNHALSKSGGVMRENIWNGIFAVIQSRIKLFEESAAKQGGFLTEINPIVIEKKGIISKSIKTFAESFNNTAQRFKIEEQKRLISLAVKNMIYNDYGSDSGLIFNDVLEKIKSSCFSMFYDFYRATVQFTIINLNDLYKRRDTHYYYELLMEEQQILSSIINIQVAVLENELLQDSSEAEQRDDLREPIMILKQAHEQLNFKVGEINLLFKSTDDKEKPIESYEEFEKSIADKLTENDVLKSGNKAFSHANALFKGNYSRFLEDLGVFACKNAQKIIKQIDMKSSLYECSKLVFEHESLVGEIMDEFSKIIDFYKANEELYADNEHKEIIAGISETVVIKIESLKESKTALAIEMTELLARFSSERAGFTETEKARHFENFREKLTAQLLDCLNEDRLGLTIVKTFCANDFYDDVIEGYKEKSIRLSEKNLETLNKKLFIFKRDSLLFEISTFEEILHYSVSILRESADGATIEFVKNIDDNTKKLMNILNKYNIEAVKPEPHEPFNGKEHEILMAETNEDFKKGEIIKVMNCGYKQNDVVILRANVIAAR